MSAFEDHVGVCVNWIVFGTSNVKKTKPNKMLNELIYRSDIFSIGNLHVKTICRPKYVSACENPHFFKYKWFYKSVDENLNTHQGAFTNSNSVENLRINHYWSRDLDFFVNQKLKRQEKFGSNVNQIIESEKSLNKILDTSILNNINLCS